MAAIDRLATLWSAAIVAVAVGVTLAMSSAGPEPAGTVTDPPAPSALCESHGYEWNDEYDYCDMRGPHVVAKICRDRGIDQQDCGDYIIELDRHGDLCREWGGNPSSCDPEAGWNADRSFREDICRVVCGF